MLFHSGANVKEHAPPLAGGSVETGVEVHDTDTLDEYSSGGKRKQGAITKCGNSHLRWLLVECATHYKAVPKISSALSHRQEGQPRWLKEISWKAQNRLYQRFTTLRKRLMHHNKIKVSVARELAGVLWEIGVKMQTQKGK